MTTYGPFVAAMAGDKYIQFVGPRDGPVGELLFYAETRVFRAWSSFTKFGARIVLPDHVAADAAAALTPEQMARCVALAIACKGGS